MSLTTTIRVLLRHVYDVGPHTTTFPLKPPTQWLEALAVGVHVAVTTTLSGVDPQLGNEVGLTVRVMLLG